MTKPKRQAQFETITGDLEGALEKLQELAGVAGTDPYLTDAQAFLTQAIATLQKHIVTEFGKGKDPAKPEGAKAKAPAA